MAHDPQACPCVPVALEQAKTGYRARYSRDFARCYAVAHSTGATAGARGCRSLRFRPWCSPPPGTPWGPRPRQNTNLNQQFPCIVETFKRSLQIMVWVLQVKSSLRMINQIEKPGGLGARSLWRPCSTPAEHACVCGDATSAPQEPSSEPTPAASRWRLARRRSAAVASRTMDLHRGEALAPLLTSAYTAPEDGRGPGRGESPAPRLLSKGYSGWGR